MGGFHGKWYVHTQRYKGNSEFHIWPEVLPPPFEPNNEQASKGYTPASGEYHVSPDGVCVVCFSSRIDVVLEPCGHVACCSTCASRLRGGCSICRAHIGNVRRLTWFPWFS